MGLGDHHVRGHQQVLAADVDSSTVIAYADDGIALNEFLYDSNRFAFSETAQDARTALKHGADIIMLDNFKPTDAKKLAKELKKARPGVLIEVSGGIRPDNIEKYASAGDIISLGWLTHSYRSIDFSMRIEPM
ncbi:MAG: hypothetical protein QXT42_02980 [Thermoplasmata archaeon]